MVNSPKLPTDLTFLLEVDADGDGIRLDQFLAQQYPAVSRSRWSRAIEAGTILVDGKVGLTAQKLKSGQRIERQGVDPAEPVPVPETIVFRGEEPEVLFEDSDILVILKPRGLTVHPGNGIGIEETVVGWALSRGKLEATIEDFVKEDDRDPMAEQRPGIVHRLDRVTSGVMVLARNPSAQTALSKQFEERTAGRLYWAVVEGSFRGMEKKRPAKVEDLLGKAPPVIGLRISRPTESGDSIISLATRLERDPKDRVRFRVSPSVAGRRAVTHICELSEASGYSVVECKLETGRTHQIRVHLGFLGHPILGDTLYHGKEHHRVWLHAHSLSLAHPKTGERMEFTAPWPAADMEWLRAQGLVLSTRRELWNALKSHSRRDGHED